MPKGCQPRGEMPLSSAERQARFRARHKDQQRAAIVHTRRRVDRRSRPQRWRGAVTELLRCKAPMLPGSKHCLTRFRARRPWTPCRPSLILTSTRSLRSTRPAVTVATDDTQWFGRFARLLDGAWPGRRPQGLRCEYRQAPALALDPATQAQRGSDAVLRSACPPPAGCHFYFARRVSFLSCADRRRPQFGRYGKLGAGELAEQSAGAALSRGLCAACGDVGIHRRTAAEAADEDAARVTGVE